MRNYFSRVPNVAKWSLTVLAMIVSGVLISWVFLNDEALNPAAKLVLEVAPKIAPEQNAFYALWGFKASPELAAFEVGEQIISAHAAALRTSGYAASFAPETFWGKQPFQDNSSPLRYCSGLSDLGDKSEKRSCLAVLSGQRDAIETKLREQDLYVQRYRALRRYPHYEDVMTPGPSMPMLPWHTFCAVGDLVDAKIVFDMTEPSRRGAALAELDQEMMLWKMIGRGASSMLSRMMSTAQLGRKYRLASELLAKYPQIADEHRDIVAKITQPLVAENINMQQVFEGEFRYLAQAIHDTRYDANVNSKGVAEPIMRPAWIPAPWEALAFKRNATINMLYADMMASGNFYSQSAVNILMQQNEFSEKLDHYKPFRPSLWLYNPVGKIVISIAPSQYKNYAYRIHDLDGYSRLVELQRRIVLSRIPSTKAGELIATADTNLLDPYTGKPMAFDAIARTISFAAKSHDTLDQASIFLELADQDRP